MKRDVPVGDRRAAGRGARAVLLAAAAQRRRAGACCAAGTGASCRSATGCATRTRTARSDLPPPSLPGAHPARQRRHRDRRAACVRICAARRTPSPVASHAAEWPARLQRLHGRLAALLPADWELWLDGGHNPGAGIVLAEHLRAWARPAGASGRRHEADEGRRRVPAPADSARSDGLGGGGTGPARCALPVEAIVEASGGVARPGPRVADALQPCAAGDGPPARVLICGSLYLAGEVLKLDAGP